MKTNNFGYPRIGSNRELKKASELYWAGKISADELLASWKKNPCDKLAIASRCRNRFNSFQRFFFLRPSFGFDTYLWELFQNVIAKLLKQTPLWICILQWHVVRKKKGKMW